MPDMCYEVNKSNRFRKRYGVLRNVPENLKTDLLVALVAVDGARFIRGFALFFRF